MKAGAVGLTFFCSAAAVEENVRLWLPLYAAATRGVRSKVGHLASVLQKNAIHGRLHTASAHRDRQKYP
jgi:hypothetical protein